MTARWVAAQRSRLDAERPTVPTGDAGAELRLYRGFSRGFLLPGLRPTGMVERTRFIDDEVVRALADGVTQFVLVGAGYDGRALRFRCPDARWFEVDHPATQPDKQRRVRETASDARDINYAPVDLLNGDVRFALRAVGLDARRPSLFICEGLFTYLPNLAVSALCSRLRDLAAPGSVIVASTLVVPVARGGKVQSIADSVLKLLGEARLGIFHPGTVETMLADTGWNVCRQATTRDSRLAGSHLLLIAAEAR
jgi:methyltransferase (TIGR00027 family)